MFRSAYLRTASAKLTIAALLPLSAAAVCNLVLPSALVAQAAANPAPQRGTIKAIAGTNLTVTTDAGTTVTIAVPDGVKVSVLAAGSTDLKTATASQFSDISVGDRVLASVKAGDTPESFTARQVVLMKSGDIAKMQASQQADWKTNGAAGLVDSIDPATGTVVVSSGGHKITVNTTAKTSFKRFSGNSVQYQDAKPATFAQLQVKDQIQARGTKSADGNTVDAAEVVSGTFRDLSGLLISVDPAAGKVTLKDLASKAMMTVDVTPTSDVRQMPAMVAQRFAMANGGGGRGARGGGAPPAAAAGGMGGPAGRRSAGGDLAQMISQFPAEKIADLQKGQAVMVVALEPTPGSSEVSAVTLLTGVDPILTANPNGGMDLSSWSIGGGGGGGAE